MFNSKLIAFAIVAASVVSSQATVTLQFSTGSAKLTNIQNAAGNATGGLRWGIVVDTSAAVQNGFDAGGLNYDGFVFPTAGSGLFLKKGDGSATTDDYFYFASSGNTTLASASGTDAGTNVISQLVGLPLTGGVLAGQKFALMWFDTTTSNDGDKYGFMTDASFVLPADSQTVNFNAAVLGVDPIRLASNTLGTVAAPVPEPSRMMLLGFGLIGLFFRRRR